VADAPRAPDVIGMHQIDAEIAKNRVIDDACFQKNARSFLLLFHGSFY
jgi:hypothetical protein